jgi:hypothetical protein
MIYLPLLAAAFVLLLIFALRFDAWLDRRDGEE